MINQINITRFIAAVLVIFFHFGHQVVATSFPFLHHLQANGNIAVSYFFLLSGFIMSVSHFNREFTAKDYWLRRFFRIYPIYIVAFGLFWYSNMYLESITKPLIAFVLCITLAQSLLPIREYYINFPSWSLSVEMFFYALFPYVFRILNKQKNSVNFIFAIIIWAVSQIVFSVLLYYNYFKFFAFFNPYLHFNTFLIGAVTGLYFMREKMHQTMGVYISTTLMLLPMLVLYVLTLSPLIFSYAHNGLFTPLFMCFVVGFSAQRSIFTKFCSNRIFVYLGDISFAMYILQMPIRRVTLYLLEKFSISGYYFLYTHILVMIVVGILSYEFIEKPIRNYYKKKA